MSRRFLWLAVLLAVLLSHATVGLWVREVQVGWAEASKPNLTRMDVAFVKELAPAAPSLQPPVVAVAPPPAPRPRADREPAASKPALPASAVVDAPEMPDPPPEPASAPPLQQAQAASAPEPELPAAGADASASAASPSAATFEWPPSTRLTYTLLGNYRGEVHGSARVQWVRQGGRYQVHLDVFIGPSFAPLVSRRMTSEGVLSAQGLAPQRYEEITKVPFQSARSVSMRFGDGQVTLANGQARPALPGLQDTASQFVHLAWFFTTQPQALHVGNSVTVPLALPRRMDEWVYDVVGQEPLQTPVGVLDTFHLKPRRPDARPQGELSAEIWFAPSLQYLPVRIRMQQDADTYADLLLDAAPLQADPEKRLGQPQAEPVPQS